MIETKIGLGVFRVKNVRFLTRHSFIVRTGRNHIHFTPGQRVKINMPGEKVSRRYSIYSSMDVPYLEFLIREVDDGYLTPRLKPLMPGDELEIFGPNGHFTLKDIDVNTSKLLFVSTGTGIAPFHSIILSTPGLNYQLVHGVRFSDEAYDRHHYEKNRLTVCTSREVGKDFNGRVTDFLKTIDPRNFDHLFLCGNRQMIDDVIYWAEVNGFSKEQIHTEVYF